MLIKSLTSGLVCIRIGNLRYLKEGFDNRSLDEAEQLITDLESIKEEVSAAKDEAELVEIKQKLDGLLCTAPEELKNLPGFFA